MHAIRPKLFFRDHGNVRQNLHNRFCCRLAFTMASKKCLAVTCTDGTDDVVVNCPSLVGKVFTFKCERDCQTSYNQESNLQFVKDHVDFGLVSLHCFQPLVKQGMGLRLFQLWLVAHEIYKTFHRVRPYDPKSLNHRSKICVTLKRQTDPSRLCSL